MSWNMNISKKIEEIRAEPEHIRLRWVWGSVAVSMMIIIAIWIFSIGSLFRNEERASDSNSQITKQLQELGQQAPSLKSLSDQALNLEAEGVSTKSSETEATYPQTNNQTEIPKADAYSNLSEELSGQQQ